LTAALIAGGIATVLNLLLFWLGGALVGSIDTLEPAGSAFRPLPFYFVVIASVVPMLAAGLGLWLFERFLPYGTRIFQVLATLLVVLSLAGPFTGQVATTAAAIVLALMHVVEGAVMIWYLTLRQ
jgi:hypothetical protein